MTFGPPLSLPHATSCWGHRLAPVINRLLQVINRLSQVIYRLSQVIYRLLPLLLHRFMCMWIICSMNSSRMSDSSSKASKRSRRHASNCRIRSFKSKSSMRRHYISICYQKIITLFKHVLSPPRSPILPGLRASRIRPCIKKLGLF